MKYIYSFLFLLSAVSGFAQGMKPASANLLGGAAFSSFLYSGAANPNINLGYTYGPQFHLNFQFEAKRHILRPEIGYRRLGATARIGDSPVNWKLQYADINLAYLISAVKTPKFSLSPGIAYGVSFMTEGEQFIGSNRYTISSPGFLKRLDLNGQFITQLRWNLNEQIHFMTEYRFGMSILSIENNQNPQSTRNMYHSVLLGLGFSISSPKKEITTPTTSL